MSEKMKSTHDTFCNYEISKAKSSRTLSVKNHNFQQKPKGIIIANVSKATLALQLASLF